MTPSPVLDEFNYLGAADAADRIFACNGSRAWADGVAAARPFDDHHELLAASDRVWWSLSPADWQQAFDSHPRIGERHARDASAQSLAWSAGEQAAANPDAQIKAELAQANRDYEARFGRIFIVCATGKSAAEMLAILRARLANTPEAELREAAEQQRQITRLRLRKWLCLA